MYTAPKSTFSLVKISLVCLDEFKFRNFLLQVLKLNQLHDWLFFYLMSWLYFVMACHLGIWARQSADTAHTILQKQLTSISNITSKFLLDDPLFFYAWRSSKIFGCHKESKSYTISWNQTIKHVLVKSSQRNQQYSIWNSIIFCSKSAMESISSIGRLIFRGSI